MEKEEIVDQDLIVNFENFLPLFEEAQGLIRYGFEKLNLHQIYANILTDNQLSMKLFLKAGFGSRVLAKSAQVANL